MPIKITSPIITTFHRLSKSTVLSLSIAKNAEKIGTVKISASGSNIARIVFISTLLL